jgi:hypothetical protein
VPIRTDGLPLATSVDVKRAFSRARILISHLRNHLSPQTTRTLICLNQWSPAGFVNDTDVLAVARLEAFEGENDNDLEPGWDTININLLK